MAAHMGAGIKAFVVWHIAVDADDDRTTKVVGRTGAGRATRWAPRAPPRKGRPQGAGGLGHHHMKKGGDTAGRAVGPP